MGIMSPMIGGAGESFSNSVLLKTLSTSNLTKYDNNYYNRPFTIYSGLEVKNLFDTYNAIYIYYTCKGDYNQTSKVIFKKSDYQYLKKLAKALPSGSFSYLKQSMYYCDSSRTRASTNPVYMDVRNYVAIHGESYLEMAETQRFMNNYCVRVYANDANDAIIGSLMENQVKVSGTTFSGQVYGLK